jgi:hypothetical protein
MIVANIFFRWGLMEFIKPYTFLYLGAQSPAILEFNQVPWI